MALTAADDDGPGASTDGTIPEKDGHDDGGEDDMFSGDGDDRDELNTAITMFMITVRL